MPCSPYSPSTGGVHEVSFDRCSPYRCCIPGHPGPGAGSHRQSRLLCAILPQRELPELRPGQSIPGQLSTSRLVRQQCPDDTVTLDAPPRAQAHALTDEAALGRPIHIRASVTSRLWQEECRQEIHIRLARTLVGRFFIGIIILSVGILLAMYFHILAL